MSTSPAPAVQDTPRRIRVVVADDHAGMRGALAELLAAEGMEVVGAAHDGPGAVALVTERRPDVALVDVRMPGLSGLEVAGRLTAAAVPTALILITGETDPGLERRAAAAGVRRVVLKGGPLDDLLAAVRAVAAGD